MREILLSAILVIVSSVPGRSLGQSSVSSEIAPGGKLRVAANVAVPVQVMRTPDGGIVGGVTFEVGKFIAEKLGLPFELVPYDGSSTYAESFGKNEWDLGVGARTPLVSEKAEFILDLLLMDYLFVAAPGRTFTDAAQVDQPGIKIGVGFDSLSEQFLSRTLKFAELVRMVNAKSIDALRSGQVDVWAASASNVEQVAAQFPEAKIVPGAFTSDQSMMILPKGRSSAARTKLVEIINEAKRSGVLQKAIEKTGAKGVRVAP